MLIHYKWPKWQSFARFGNKRAEWLVRSHTTKCIHYVSMSRNVPHQCLRSPECVQTNKGSVHMDAGNVSCGFCVVMDVFFYIFMLSTNQHDRATVSEPIWNPRSYKPTDSFMVRNRVYKDDDVASKSTHFATTLSVAGF